MQGAVLVIQCSCLCCTYDNKSLELTDVGRNDLQYNFLTHLG